MKEAMPLPFFDQNYLTTFGFYTELRNTYLLTS